MHGQMRVRILLLICGFSSASFGADRVVLKDGFVLSGDISVEENRIVIQSGPRTYYVGSRQLLQPQPVQGEYKELFTLQQPVAQRARPVVSVRRIMSVGEFDEYGRRNIVIRDEEDRDLPIIQAITEVHSTHVVLEGVERTWQSKLSLDQVPTNVLVSLLKRATDQKDGLERVRTTAFLIHAERFEAADAELKELESQFPEQSSQAAQLREKWAKGIVDRALTLARRALDCGQFERATKLIASLDSFEVPESERGSVELYREQLQQTREKLAAAQMLLEKDLAAVAGIEGATQAQAAVDEIKANLTPKLIERLQPALGQADQAQTSPKERLALAISGWIAGPTLAQTDWDSVIDLWEDRQTIQLALSAKAELPLQQAISAIKSRKLQSGMLVELIGHLPAPETSLSIATVNMVEAERENLEPMRYHVFLPPEYRPHHRYPTIVTLHGLQTTPEQQIQYWKTAASEHGYIVVAPEYRAELSRPYEYSLLEHRNVLDVINHVRRSFAVDADRVFLSGHELGGFAAWDIGMSHPDQFAGLIPIAGAPAFYCKHYWPNVINLPIYAVEGSLNGGNPVQIQNEFLRYFANGYDAVYVEYPGRGRELFSSELPTIFDWMSRKSRKAVPLEIDVVAARHSDHRFFWLDIESFLRTATVAPQLFNRARFRPAKLNGTVTDSNQILVTCSGVDKLSVLIPHGLIHLDDPRVSIRVNRKVLHRGPIEPDLDLMIRELRETGDRKNLIVAKFHIGRL